MISNEAKIRVKIDGTDAEVSIQDLGRVIQKTMEQGKASADKLKSSFQKIGDFSQRLFFSFKSFGMVINQVSRLSSMALKAGTGASASAESYRKFSDSLERLKIQGGRLINVFLMPVMELTSKFVTWLESLNQKSVLMVGTIGMAGIAVAKLIPLLRTLGITSKAALGWIGVIITGIMSLYAAWSTNTWGMREKLTGFWYFIKGWAEQLGKTLTALGNIIKGVFDRSWSSITEGWEKLKESFKWDIVAAWKDAFAKAKAEADKFVPKMQAVGEASGEAFSVGMERGISKKEKKTWREFEKQIKKVDKSIDDFKQKMKDWEAEFDQGTISEVVETMKDRYKNMFDEFGNSAQLAFSAVSSAMNMLGDRLTQALWNTKTKFKDLWQAMAMDFTRIFVNHVLATLAKFLAFKVLGNVIPGFGTAVSAISTVGPGVSISGGNIGNLENQLTLLNSNVSKLSAPATVNNFIQGRQLYDAVKWQRSKELMRRGRDVNNELF